MANATSFWGNAAGNAGDNYTITCSGTASTNGKTCNGNGDGIINAIWSSAYAYEGWRYWQQLALAGLIEGNYNGFAGAANVAGVNLPGAKIANAVWGNGYYPNFGGDVNTFMHDYGFFFQIARPADGGPVMTPADAWNIDTKYDDGRPASGSIIGAWISSCTSASSASDMTATYSLNSSILGCGLMFAKVN